MSRPYRTRRRLLRSYADLDENLWPLCLERQIHKLDRLILTQMSPGNIQVSQKSIFFSELNCNKDGLIKNLVKSYA